MKLKSKVECKMQLQTAEIFATDIIWALQFKSHLQQSIGKYLIPRYVQRVEAIQYFLGYLLGYLNLPHCTWLNQFEGTFKWVKVNNFTGKVGCCMNEGIQVSPDKAMSRLSYFEYFFFSHAFHIWFAEKFGQDGMAIRNIGNSYLYFNIKAT